MPTPGGIDVNMNGAQLAAYELPLVDEARRPQASCDRGLFEEADFDVGGVERFVLDSGRFDHCEPLRFIYQLAVRKYAAHAIQLNNGTYFYRVYGDDCA